MSGPGVPEGMLTLDELQAAAGRDDIDTVVVGFTDHYGRLVGKRYDAGMFLDEVAAHGTHGCDYLLTTDMEMEPVPGYELANWELGYGDVHLVPDLGTLRRAAWLDRTALVLCDVADGGDGSGGSGGGDGAPVQVAPRTILRRQVDAAAAQGLTSMAATELEYYLYRSSYRDAAASGYADLAARRLVPRGLPPAAGRPHGGLHGRGAPPPAPLRACPSSRARASGASASTS